MSARSRSSPGGVKPLLALSRLFYGCSPDTMATGARMLAEHTHGGGTAMGWLLLTPFVVAGVFYVTAAAGEKRRGRRWPWWRTVLWVSGLFIATSGLVLPTTAGSSSMFTLHVLGHVLTGMVAPLCLVLAAPMTLALRTMAVQPARRLSRLLRSAPLRVLLNPFVAGTLNLGSMWLLYRTSLFELSMTPFLHHLIMVHFLVTGYLFTASLISPDPTPHRPSTRTLLIALGLSIAAHSVLAKQIYGHPLSGLDVADVRVGAEIMFYAGDAVDLVLIALVLARWYRSTGRRIRRAEPAEAERAESER